MKHHITKRRKMAAYKRLKQHYELRSWEHQLIKSIINERGGYYYEVVSVDTVSMCYFNNEEFKYVFTTINLNSGKFNRWAP